MAVVVLSELELEESVGEGVWPRAWFKFFLKVTGRACVPSFQFQKFLMAPGRRRRRNSVTSIPTGKIAFASLSSITKVCKEQRTR